MPTNPPSKNERRPVKLFGRRWKLYALVALAGPLVVFMGVLGYYYVVFSRMIDARIHGEMQRVDPRVFARPFEVRRGQSVSPRQLVDRLNELGYANRAQSGQPGEFTVGRDAIVLVPRDGDRKGQTVRIVFGMRSAKTKETTAIDHLEIVGQKSRPEQLTLDPPLITALVSSGREKRRDVPLQLIPQHMIQAVLAIEDRRFYDHVGVDPIGIASAVWDYVSGRKPYLRGGSTLTQQLIKNTFLTQERSPIRKLQDQFMALILERRLSKDQVLELYLNDVWLGQRGSFAVHGVAEASRLFFAKHISNVSLSRSGAHRRRHPVSAAAFAVRPSGSRQGAPGRRAAGDGRGRLRQRRGRRARHAGARAGRRPRARSGGAVFRRLHQPGAAGQIQRRREHGRRLHDARSAPAAPRAGRACATV